MLCENREWGWYINIDDDTNDADYTNTTTSTCFINNGTATTNNVNNVENSTTNNVNNVENSTTNNVKNANSTILKKRVTKNKKEKKKGMCIIS